MNSKDTNKVSPFFIFKVLFRLLGCIALAYQYFALASILFLGSELYSILEYACHYDNDIDGDLHIKGDLYVNKIYGTLICRRAKKETSDK